jgi:pantetheine-phosphate adenylyltransferase
MRITALFPATFDPITCGHVDIAERASRLFDVLIIGVYEHPDGRIKRTLFTIDERLALAESAISHLANVVVKPFGGLAVQFAQSEGAGVLVRGLRVADDFEFERQMAMLNRHLAPEVDSVLFVTQPDHAFVSATRVREVALLGGDVGGLVPPAVAVALERKRREAGEFSLAPRH